MDIREVPVYIWAFVLAGIVAGVGVLTLTELNTSVGETQAANDSIMNATVGIANLAAQLPTVGTIVGVSLIVGVVVLLFFAFRGGEGKGMY